MSWTFYKSDGSVLTSQGTATVATTVTVSDNESTNENNVLTFVAGADADGGNVGLESDGNLHYNPSSGLLTSPAFAGALTGNVTGNASGTAATVTGGTQASITSTANLVTVGALNAGSITSGFGTIDTGSSTIGTTGVITAGGFTIGSAVVDEAELEILDGATVTTAELNIIDGGTSATGTTIADADRVVLNDNGTMVQVAVTDLKTYIGTGPAQAVRSELEAAETNDVDKYSPPDLIHFVPSAVKAWVSWTNVGTAAIKDSYNISGITDNGTGDAILAFDNDMADTDYAWGAGTGTYSRTWVNTSNCLATSIEVLSETDAGVRLDQAENGLMVAGVLAA